MLYSKRWPAAVGTHPGALVDVEGDLVMIARWIVEAEWIQTEDPAVSLTPPFQRRVVEIDADRELFQRMAPLLAACRRAPGKGVLARAPRRALPRPLRRQNWSRWQFLMCPAMTHRQLVRVRP